MKYVIASDVHGNIENLKELFRRLLFEKPTKLILLGDLYYHGPRNPITSGYDPMATAKFLNEHKRFLVAVRGNCDAEVDQMISEFRLKPNYKMNLGRLKVFFAHGHKMNEQQLLDEYDVIVYGHTHCGFIKKKGKKIVANCGSVGLPKNNTPCSYIVLDEREIALKDFKGKVIESVALQK